MGVPASASGVLGLHRAIIGALRPGAVPLSPCNNAGVAGERIPEADAIEIRRLDPAEIDQHIDALAVVLEDVVAGGASIGYMAPFSHLDARDAFTSFAAEVAHGRRLLLAGFLDGALVGTVQVILAAPPNQPHRGEITKLLVHRSGRRRGVARRLMERAETEALSAGKTLLVLDTADDTAERLYSRLGWTFVGVIPGFALFPDGCPCATTVFYKTLL